MKFVLLDNRKTIANYNLFVYCYCCDSRHNRRFACLTTTFVPLREVKTDRFSHIEKSRFPLLSATILLLMQIEIKRLHRGADLPRTMAIGVRVNKVVGSQHKDDYHLFQC